MNYFFDGITAKEPTAKFRVRDPSPKFRGAYGLVLIAYGVADLLIFSQADQPHNTDRPTSHRKEPDLT